MKQVRTAVVATFIVGSIMGDCRAVAGENGRKNFAAGICGANDAIGTAERIYPH